MALALAAVTYLVEQVKEVMEGYPDLISGAETEFRQTIDELSLLRAFLRDVATKTKKNKKHTFKELDRQAREVVYEVEELMDVCLAKAAEAMSKKMPRTLAFVANPKRFNLAKEMKSIREEKLLPLMEDATAKFALVAHIDVESRGVEYTRSTTNKDRPMKRNRIVGFEEEEEKITGYLIEEMTELEVIAITGISGQGKTTLAWKIYGKDEIRNRFPIRVWVNISQNFSSRDVFLQILRNFVPSQSMSSDLNDKELAQTVSECLKKERFLLVLDDVWSVDVWNKIEKVLPLKNGVSKVIITSREKDVAAHSRRVRKPQLTAQESWKLLQYEVFGNEEDCPQELREIGMKIAKKCDGVPLAIVVVGGILTDKLSRSTSTGAPVKEWEMMLEYVPDSLQGSEAARLIEDVVELSYRTLPDDLRECFVYLGVFPENYEISGKLLSGLWISEGFILPRDGRSLEDSAEEMRNDLVSRNLLRVEKTNRVGKPKTFRVPKSIRAFCITKCNKDNLFQEVRESHNGVLKPSPAEFQNLRRLCFHSSVPKFFSTRPNGPRVRSFLCFHAQPVEIETQFIPDSFPKLRILESKSIFQQFPEKFTNLIHLRFLTMHIATLEVLPNDFTKLWNLVSLVVETKSHTITMKANIWRMFRLRYVKTKAAIVLDDKKWEGEAGNLQTLYRLSAESCTEVVSQRAKNLKTLGISGNLASVFESNFLAELRRVEKLKLVSATRDLRQPRVFPLNLRRLTLTNTGFDWHHMSTLAEIKSLETLKLKDNAFCGVMWKAVGYTFTSLQLLLIARTDLVLWNASEDTFPGLRFLVLTNCENLLEIPECVGARLRKLEVAHLRCSAVESAKRIAETKNAEFNLNIGPTSDK